jgi:probable HAF family extracellular repeat protein
MKRELSLIVALVAAVLMPQQQYVTAAKPGNSNILDLGTLGGSYSAAFGVNNDAAVVQVVGWSWTAGNDAVHAFVWSAPAGPMIDLGTLGGGSSQALDINNHGQTAGFSHDALNQRWAVVWTNTGGTWTVENLGVFTGASCPPSDFLCSQAFGINNGIAGDPATVAVVGNSRVSPDEFHAVMWTKSPTGWTVQDLGTLPGGTGSLAHDVNDHGQIVGVSGSATGVTAFVWTPTTGMLPLSSLGGETYALAIGNNGDVAGLSTDSSGNRHAVRWRSATNWTIEDLGTLGGCCSEGYGINSSGDVVGVSNIGRRRSSSQHAFLANSSGITDLGALQGTSAARDLNDFGIVVGETGSRLHAALWTLPTP